MLIKFDLNEMYMYVKNLSLFAFLKTRSKVEIGCLFYHAFTCESSMYRAM